MNAPIVALRSDRPSENPFRGTDLPDVSSSEPRSLIELPAPVATAASTPRSNRPERRDSVAELARNELKPVVQLQEARKEARIVFAVRALLVLTPWNGQHMIVPHLLRGADHRLSRASLRRPLCSILGPWE